MTADTLETIREAEFEAARKVEAAETDAEATVAEARRAARKLVERAQSEGRHEAERRFDAAVDTARTEAQSITAATKIEEMRTAVQPQLPSLVDAFVELVLAPPAGKDH